MNQLIKEVIINLLKATGIFAVVIAFLYFIGQLVDANGHLFDPYLPLALVAGIVGSSYVLIVRNPQNFLGFVVGIIMSILLGIQFWLTGLEDQTVLYYAIFIPCQVYTMVKWFKGSKYLSSSKYTIPSFLSKRGFSIVLIVFAVIFGLDLFLQKQFMGREINLALVMSAAVVASSTQANILMIRKRTDAWFYWLLFSVTGIIQMICLHNYVTLTLYVLYLFINGSACIAWCKLTPKERYGWLKMFQKDKE